ncbi:GntP family permease [Acidaminococcus massiliensis]|uniref:GntP family permease n=1 Tax=Acidaminococcus massiliensis TaxID=1852375 RepID=UPI0035217173
MSETMIIVVFFISLGILLFGIMKLKMDSGVMMLITSLITGIILMMPAKVLVGTVAKGFGNMMAALGIVVGLGSILGGILSESGATDQLALAMLRKFGSKNANVALNATGYLISIPVFMGPAYIILNPICTTLARHTKKSVMGYTTALVVGLMCTHCLVIPTPGPLAVSGSLGANVGLFILYSLVVSAPASICGGILYGNYLTKRFSDNAESDSVTDDESIREIEKNQKAVHPSALDAVFLILLPIILILFATLAPYITKEPFVMNICIFLSAANGVGALLLSDLIAWMMLSKYIEKSPSKVFGSSLNDVGDIFFILAASGSYGAIISASGIGKVLGSMISAAHIPLFLMAFVMSVLLKAALGSSATALVTTASLIAPMMSTTGGNPIIVGLAICLGGLGICLPTDGAFWEVKEFNGLTMKETFIAHTGGNLIACIVGFIMLCVLSRLIFLPGI